MRMLLLFIMFSSSVMAEEELSARDKLVREARRVEKAVTKDLGSVREKGCKALKGTECVPTKKEENAEKPNTDSAN